MDPAPIRASFATLVPHADELAQRFYTRLFTTYPQVRPLFTSTDMAEQRSKLLSTLGAVVASVDRPESLLPVLEAMGRRHAGYGVRAHEYAYVTSALLTTMAEMAGEAWTPPVASAWDEALAFVGRTMIAAQERAA